MRKEDTDFKQIKKNIEEMEMKNSDMDLLAKHLDENTQGTLKTAKKLINENLPKIHETFKVIYKYALTLKKMLKSIPYKKNEDTGEVIIQCTMINCNLSTEKELLQVFENLIANLCAFQLLMQRHNLENYVNALRKSENTFIIDHTPLEVVKLHTIAYAQTHFISDFSFGLCDEEM